MDNLKITGEVTIKKIDIITGEIYEIIGPECNDVSWMWLATSLLDSTGTTMQVTRPLTGVQLSPWQLSYSRYNLNQSIVNTAIPIGTANGEEIGGSINLEVGSPYFTPKALPGEKDFVSFVAVLNPLGSGNGNRIIKSLGLKLAVSGNNANFTNNSAYNTLTNLNLSVPCTQGETTQLQITYRLYLDDFVPSATISNISDSYYFYLRNLFKEMSDGTYTGTTPISVGKFSRNLISSFYDNDLITNLKGVSILPAVDTSYNKTGGKTGSNAIYNSSLTYDIYDDLIHTFTSTYTLTDLNTMGLFFRTLNLGNGNASYTTGAIKSDMPFLYQRAIPTTSSPITNVFKQTANPIGPFQDINSISPMSGNLTLGVNGWVRQPFPKLVRVKIALDGDETTARYTFETLNFTAGFIQNGFCPRPADIPQDGGDTTLANYHRMIPGEQVITEQVNIGATVIRAVNDTNLFVAVNGNRTKDAISIYDIETGDKVTLSAVTTPSLPVTNTSDVTVSNGYIFVTCSNTGLWQIDPTLSVVTHITTIGAGVDGSKAYQIDSKSNGDLWVLFEGGLAKGVTANSGATWTWTVYNPTSGTVFNAVGITDSKWANVSSMVIDKVHANNRILFITGTTTSPNTNASSFIWWEGSTGTTTVMSTGLAYPSFSLIENLKRSDMLQCVGGVWTTNIVSNASNNSNAPMYTTSFGNGVWTTKTLSNSPTEFYQNLRAYPATVAGVKGAFLGTGPAYYHVVSAGAAPFFISESNFSSLPASIPFTSPLIEFFTRFGNIDTTVSDIRLDVPNAGYDTNRGSCPVVYFPSSNMLVNYNHATNTFSVAPLVIDPSITNYNTFKSACWKEYGWDGSDWVLNNTNSKLCHNTADTLIDGITIAFNNGISGSHFINTHQFTFVVGDGIMKDNATDYTFRLSFSPTATETISEFYTQTEGQVTNVPSYRYGTMTDEYVNFSLQTPTQTGTRGIIQTRGRISGIEKVSSAVRFTGQKIPANTPFTYKYKLITPAPAHNNIAAYTTLIVNNVGTNIYSLKRDGSGNYCLYSSSSTIIATIPKASLDTTTDIILERGNDNKLYFYYGNKLIYSTTTQESTDSYIRMDISNGEGAQGEMGHYDMRLTYTELRRLVKIGNLANSTGHFNPKFMGTTPVNTIGDSKIVTNNIDRTIVNGIPYWPISGFQVRIDTKCGYVVFQDLPTVSYPSTGSPVTGPCLAPVVTGGVVTSIDIISSGSGFVTTPTLTISAPVAGGTTATATATLTATKSVNDFVTITNAGVGYTDGTYTLVFSGGGGANAAGTVVVSDGVVRRVNISNGGDSYTSAPTLSFVGAGSPTTAAVLTPTIGYRIASVTVTDGGSGYITDGGTPLVGYATAHYLP